MEQPMEDKSDSQPRKKRKKGLKFIKSSLRDILGSLHDEYLVKNIESCPYFESDLESFGIMLKGKSLEQFPKYDKEFENCFLVNNFDKEFGAIGSSLEGKKCVHLVNRLITAPLTPENYKRFNITEVQLPKVSAVGDRKFKPALKHYKSLGLKMHYLPKKLLKFNKQDYGKEYAKKYPNTGILAIIYALEMLRPKTLWIFGLDFYQSDYLFRRPHQSTIDLQRAKMKRVNMPEVTANIFRQFPEVQVNMVSYYEGFPDVPNVRFYK
jgi:hypothetical protein